MKLQLSTHVARGITVVNCNGRILLGDETDVLRETVKKEIARNPNIVLNLKNVTHIDSGGLGTMVGLYTSARNAQGHVKLAELTPHSNHLMVMTKLSTVFEIFDKEEDAVASFAMEVAKAS
jgi:anti-sigma B factor antagonist